MHSTVLLKSGYQLNRSIAWCMVFFLMLRIPTFFSAFRLLFAGPPFLLNPLPSILQTVLLGLLTIGFLIWNETLLYRFRQQHPLVTSPLNPASEKQALFISWLSGCILLAAYGLSGQWGILLLLMIVGLQADLFENHITARIFLCLPLVVYLISLPWGYPHLPVVHPVTLQVGLTLFPFLAVLTHYAHLVTKIIHSTTHRASRLQSLAITDGLTDLGNRRQFNHQLESEIARAKRYRSPLSLALFDIDDFKKINDSFGHPTGDRILKELSRLLMGNIRESDIPARYGGEEFALILPQTVQADAYELLERLRVLVAHTVFCLPDNPITLSISVGVSQLELHHADSVLLIENTDTALYAAKRQGKNKVLCFKEVVSLS